MDKPKGGWQPGFVDIPDHVVEEFIHQHPNGASMVEIGEALGITRERVYQILRKALAKCQVAALRAGINADDFPSRESVWDRLESS